MIGSHDLKGSAAPLRRNPDEGAGARLAGSTSRIALADQPCPSARSIGRISRSRAASTGIDGEDSGLGSMARGKSRPGHIYASPPCRVSSCLATAIIDLTFTI